MAPEEARSGRQAGACQRDAQCRAVFIPAKPVCALVKRRYMYLKERCSETEDGSCNPYPWQMLVALGRDDLHKSYLGYTYCDDLEALGYIKMQGYGKDKKIFIIKDIDF